MYKNKYNENIYINIKKIIYTFPFKIKTNGFKKYKQNIKIFLIKKKNWPI